MPYEDNYFDVVFGQDPDVFGHPPRLKCLKECFRILRPGGFCTVSSSLDAWTKLGQEVLKKYCEKSGSELDTTADTYKRDILAAGFEIEQDNDISDLAKSHFSGQLKNMEERTKAEGQDMLQWLVARVEYLNEGHKFGVECLATK